MLFPLMYYHQTSSLSTAKQCQDAQVKLRFFEKFLPEASARGVGRCYQQEGAF